MATRKDQTPDPAFGRAPEPELMVVSEPAPSVPVEVVPEVPRDANRPYTFGERACGVPFNPGGDPTVAKIKAQFAVIVDTIHGLRESSIDGEVQRMLAIAMTEAQTAQMWAVKAITWRG